MDPITQQRLVYLMACVPESVARRLVRHFGPVISPNASYNAAELGVSRNQAQAIEACIYPHPIAPPSLEALPVYPNQQTVERCFRQVLGNQVLPNLTQLLPFTERGRMVCGNFALSTDLDYQFFHPQRALRESYTQYLEPHLSDFDPHDQALLQGIYHFYMGLLGPQEQEAFLLENLRDIPSDLAQRRSAYNFPTERMEAVASPVGRSSRFWMTRELTVPGFRYKVPIVFLRSEEESWPQFERNLRFVFELFKLFITPQNLEGILRPNFAFLLAPRPPFSPEVLNDGNIHASRSMNDEWVGGFADPRQHYIMARQHNFNQPLISLQGNRDGVMRPVVSSILSEVFFHEFAHHIDFYSFSSRDRENLSILRNWLQDLFERSGGTNFYAPLHSSRSGDPRPYALQDTYELFAEFATEWMVYQTERFFRIPHPVLNPLVARHREARLDLMGQFFSQDGMRREVFELENIEATYRRHGIEVNLDEVAASMLSVETRVAVQQDHSGQLGGEVSVGVRTNSRRHANLSFGLSGGLFSPGRNTYLLGEVGVRSPLAPFQIESSVVNGVDLGNGDVLLGIGARLSYFPFDPGFGLNFFGGARVLADTHQGEVRGLFQLGVGYVPRWSF